MTRTPVYPEPEWYRDRARAAPAPSARQWLAQEMDRELTEGEREARADPGVQFLPTPEQMEWARSPGGRRSLRALRATLEPGLTDIWRD